ncbi:MAG: kelch repeat-containing protein [Herbinix sp.]|nr:kelch repeat-containing protein [Herbinix sp.]
MAKLNTMTTKHLTVTGKVTTNAMNNLFKNRFNTSIQNEHQTFSGLINILNPGFINDISLEGNLTYKTENAQEIGFPTREAYIEHKENRNSPLREEINAILGGIFIPSFFERDMYVTDEYVGIIVHDGVGTIKRVEREFGTRLQDIDLGINLFNAKTLVDGTTLFALCLNKIYIVNLLTLDKKVLEYEFFHASGRCGLVYRKEDNSLYIMNLSTFTNGYAFNYQLKLDTLDLIQLIDYQSNRYQPNKFFYETIEFENKVELKENNSLIPFGKGFIGIGKDPKNYILATFDYERIDTTYYCIDKIDEVFVYGDKAYLIHYNEKYMSVVNINGKIIDKRPLLETANRQIYNIVGVDDKNVYCITYESKNKAILFSNNEGNVEDICSFDMIMMAPIVTIREDDFVTIFSKGNIDGILFDSKDKMNPSLTFSGSNFKVYGDTFTINTKLKVLADSKYISTLKSGINTLLVDGLALSNTNDGKINIWSDVYTNPLRALKAESDMVRDPSDIRDNSISLTGVDWLIYDGKNIVNNKMQTVFNGYVFSTDNKAWHITKSSTYPAWYTDDYAGYKALLCECYISSQDINAVVCFLNHPTLIKEVNYFKSGNNYSRLAHVKKLFLPEAFVMMDYGNTYRLNLSTGVMYSKDESDVTYAMGAQGSDGENFFAYELKNKLRNMSLISVKKTNTPSGEKSRIISMIEDSGDMYSDGDKTKNIYALVQRDSPALSLYKYENFQMIKILDDIYTASGNVDNLLIYNNCLYWFNVETGNTNGILKQYDLLSGEEKGIGMGIPPSVNSAITIGFIDGRFYIFIIKSSDKNTLYYYGEKTGTINIEYNEIPIGDLNYLRWIKTKNDDEIILILDNKYLLRLNSLDDISVKAEDVGGLLTQSNSTVYGLIKNPLEDFTIGNAPGNEYTKKFKQFCLYYDIKTNINHIFNADNYMQISKHPTEEFQNPFKIKGYEIDDVEDNLVLYRPENGRVVEGVKNVDFNKYEIDGYEPSPITYGPSLAFPRFNGIVEKYGDYIYILGGNNGISGPPSVNYVERYDTKTNTLKSINTGGGFGSTVSHIFYNNKIYVCGNNVSIQIFDCETETKSMSSASSDNRHGACSVLYNDKIYMMSGQSSSMYYNSVKIYDISTDTWTYGSESTYKHDEGSAILYNMKIYLIGGGYSSRLEIYDIATDTWTLGANLPIARYRQSCHLYGGDIYCIGGVTGSPTIIKYNIETNTWSSMASMQFPRATNQTTQLIDDKIYIMGGNINSDESLIEIYDITNNTVSVYCELDIGMRRNKSVVVGDYIYMLCGHDVNNTYETNIMTQINRIKKIKIKDYNYLSLLLGKVYHHTTTLYNEKLYIVTGYEDGSLSRNLYEYDLKSNTIRKKSKPLYTHFYHTATLYNDKIYIIGGNANNKIEVYDIKSDTWSDGPTLATSYRTHHTSELVNGKIYIIGGNTGNTQGTPIAPIEIFDIANNTINTIKSLTVPRYRHTSHVYGDKIYIIGGCKATASPDDHFKSIEIYNTSDDTISNGPNINFARSYHNSILYKDKIYIFNGRTNISLKSIEVYSLTTNTVTSVGNFNDIRWQCESVLFNDKIYVFGGQNGSNLYTSYETFDINTYEVVKKELNYRVSYSFNAILFRDKAYLVGGINPYPLYSIYKVNLNEYEDSANLLDLRSMDIKYTDTSLKNSFFINDSFNSVSVVKENDQTFVKLIQATDTSNTQFKSRLLNSNLMDKDEFTKYMKYTRTSCTVTEYNNKAYIIGGSTDTMEIYNLITGEITDGASMEYSRSGHDAILCGDNIYVIGGIGGPTKIEKYNIPTNTWTTINVSLDIYKPILFLYNNNIYICQEDILKIFNITTNTISDGNSPSGSYTRITSAELFNGKIYLFYNNAGLYMQIYTISTGIWGTATKIHNDAPYILYTSIYRGIIYVFNGSEEDEKFLFKPDIYNAVTGNWVLKSKSEYFIHSKPVQYRNKLYFIGSRDNNKRGIVYYDIKTDTLYDAIDDITIYQGGPTIIFKDQLHFIGGYNTNEIRIRDFKSIINNHKSTLYWNPYYFYKNKLYIFGGSIDSTYTPSIIEYDPINKTEKTITGNTSINSEANTIQIDDSIYVLGGRNSSGVVTTMPVYNCNQSGLVPSVISTTITLGGFYSSGCFRYGDDIYILGIGTTRSNPIKRYNISTNTVHSVSATMPNTVPVSSFIYEIDEKIYMITFDNSSNNEAGIYEIEVESYNLIFKKIHYTGELRKKAQRLPILFNSRIYLIGGFGGATYWDTVDVFDGKYETFNSITPIKNGRGYHSGFNIGNKAFLIGGRMTDTDFFKSTEIYEIFDDTCYKTFIFKEDGNLYLYVLVYTNFNLYIMKYDINNDYKIVYEKFYMAEVDYDDGTFCATMDYLGNILYRKNNIHYCNSKIIQNISYKSKLYKFNEGFISKSDRSYIIYDEDYRILTTENRYSYGGIQLTDEDRLYLYRDNEVSHIERDNTKLMLDIGYSVPDNKSHMRSKTKDSPIGKLGSWTNWSR